MTNKEKWMKEMNYYVGLFITLKRLRVINHRDYIEYIKMVYDKLY